MTHRTPTSTGACGTVLGYRRHHKRAEEPCRPCKDAYAALRKSQYVRLPITTRECRGCGEMFQSRVPRQIWCSDVCCRRSFGSARKARRRGAQVERVWRAAIFKRDGWRCQICGRPVDPSKKYPHPQAPTLDHIIPLAEGGAHSPENVQCAHFKCNSSKGSRTVAKGEQLRLIG